MVNEYNIVPKPNQILPREGRFKLSNKVCLVVPPNAPEAKEIANSLAEQLKLTAGISLKETESTEHKSMKINGTFTGNVLTFHLENIKPTKT